MTPTGLAISGLARSIGTTPVLRGVDLAVAGGELVALLGPSGCGKTTLLRLVAGFDRPEAGTIALDGRPLAGPEAFVPAHARGIGFVPQEGALFPNLSVGDNIAFGLGRTGRADRVGTMLDLIGLPGFAKRLPHALSGGQQQRVALARALAPNPNLVLLDEPFNALDSALRRTLCADVRRILKEAGATGIVVTHDRDEAFAMADRVAIMRAGRIVQTGTPRHVYAEPVDLETASLVGATVCLPGRLNGPVVATPLGTLAVGNPGAFDDRDVVAMVRPEQIVRAPDGSGIVAAVRDTTFVGPLVWLDLVVEDDTGPLGLQACWPAGTTGSLGAQITIAVAGPALVFPPG